MIIIFSVLIIQSNDGQKRPKSTRIEKMIKFENRDQVERFRRAVGFRAARKLGYPVDITFEFKETPFFGPCGDRG